MEKLLVLVAHVERLCWSRRGPNPVPFGLESNALSTKLSCPPRCLFSELTSSPTNSSLSQEDPWLDSQEIFVIVSSLHLALILRWESLWKSHRTHFTVSCLIVFLVLRTLASFLFFSFLLLLLYISVFIVRGLVKLLMPWPMRLTQNIFSFFFSPKIELFFMLTAYSCQN
jgi:hypothetical protein